MQDTNRTAAGVDHQSCAPGPLIVGHHASGIRLSNRSWRICISRQRDGRSVWNSFRLRLFPLVTSARNERGNRVPASKEAYGHAKACGAERLCAQGS